MLEKLLKPFASLKLTVVLLALAIVLVFAGTWAQIDQDVWTVQKRYFHSFFAWIDLQLFLPRPAPGQAPIRGGFPMPGGYTIIALLLVNLLAAHSLRFKFHKLDVLIPLELALVGVLAWPTYQLGFYVMFAVIFAASIPLVLHALILHGKRGGVILIHLGLILLICGEVVTSVWQRENTMRIDEGQTVNFVEDARAVELVVIDRSPAQHDQVTAIPESRLRPGAKLEHPALPFTVEVDEYFGNSAVLGPAQARSANITPPKRPATAGLVVQQPITVVRDASVSGTSGRRNAPSAYVTLTSVDGGLPLGTYVVSLYFDDAQEVHVGDKSYWIALRPKREYRPYSLTLSDFRHDKYTGTDVARNFSSDVLLEDPSRGEKRNVKIWMNHPLRYAGETFFQSSFLPDERTTILQVVRNPGWLIPYVSCSIVTMGMIAHFGLHLAQFLKRRTTRPEPAKHSGKLAARPDRYTLKPQTPSVIWPMVAVLACVLLLLMSGRPPKNDSAYNLNAFGRVPISWEGRVIPFDTLAQSSLRVMSGKSVARDPKGKSVAATQWLIDVFTNRPAAREYRVFRITHPDLIDLLNLDAQRPRLAYSYSEIMKSVATLQEQLNRASAVERNKRTLFQRAVVELADHITLFHRLQDGSTLFIAPPLAPGEDWKTLDQAAREAEATMRPTTTGARDAEAAATAPASRPNPGYAAYATMLNAYAGDQPELFNEAAGRYLGWVHDHLPAVSKRAGAEVMFNHFAPFYTSMMLYVIVFLFVCASWLAGNRWRPSLQRTAFWILLLTVVYHTIALVARIYISGRPPVTNLYGSAIFIGWAAALLCVGLELVHKNSLGSLGAAVVAFPSLIVAHFLALSQADTMQMLQAVLDTNFWLATHVVVITLGYAATFLAGMLGMVFVLGGVLTRALSDENAKKSLSRMIYGIVCFAMLFSFVGTVLGGIWADQSWGRFWGWDPKENGAVLIVLWNAIILHARWAGIARERGVANLAIFGNVMTSWSWFGTNMLGVGLHSYGFMDSAVFWLAVFIASQLLLIAIGSLPLRRWRSHVPATG